MKHDLKYFLCGAAVAAMLPLSGAEPIIVNSSFDHPGAGAVPSGWSLRISGNAKCKVALDGKGALLIRNESPMAPSVYGSLGQLAKLTPGTEYILKVRAKGAGSGLQIAMGKGWPSRFPINSLNSDWQDYEFRFLAPEEVDADGRTPVDILCENVSPEIWIDSLTIEPVIPLCVEDAGYQDSRVYGVRELKTDFAALRSIPAGLPRLRIPRDGSNSENWKVPTKPDFSSEIAFGRDSRGLIFLAKVSDQAPQVKSGENMWTGDSIQLRIDRAGSRLSDAAPTDLELGFSIDPDGKLHNWCWDSGSDPYAHSELPPELLSLHGFRTEGGYFIAARIAWKLLGGIDAADNGKFGFTVAVNDSDRPGERTVYFLTPGLHDRKYSDQYFQALFLGKEPFSWVWLSDTANPRVLPGILLASGETGEFLFTADVSAADGTRFTRELGRASGVKPADLLKVPFSVPLDRLPEGKYEVDFKIDGRSVRKFSAVKVDLYKQQTAAVAKLTAELARLNRKFDTFYGNRPRSEYVNAMLQALNSHLSQLADNLSKADSDGKKRFYAEQAAVANPGTADALSDLNGMLEQLKSGHQLPETWKFRTSPITLADGWPVATAVSDRGKTEKRPVVCVGFGAFADIDRDIAKFQNIAANTVQVEIGPLWLFPREGTPREFEPDFKFFDTRFQPLLKKAYENNVAVNLLISPHYCPPWLLEKYPDMKSVAGFLKYEVTHPKAAEMLKVYVPAIINRIKSSPYAGAIHSICISNEPYYTNCSPGNPYSVAAFVKYMTKKYGPVNAFNAAAKKNFASYEAVAAGAKQDKAAQFEFYSFAKQTFADWHRMLADEVHQVWPEMPVHAKIIVGDATYTPVSGVDPELMAEFSDYNGNDTYLFSTDYWHNNALSHEIQISSKPVSIANSENHIIRDRVMQPVSNDYVYSMIFQQYIAGVSTVITWVYADIGYEFARQNPKDDLLANIYLRPGNMATHAKVALDGMRLAPELRKFLQYQPEVGVLYAPTAVLLNGKAYHDKLDELYTALCFTGYRPRTLSERQLAAGDFGKTRVLFAAGAANVSDAALKGLEKFAAQGGRIIADAESFRENEFGNPVSPAFAVERLGKPDAASLTSQIVRSVNPLPAGVRVKHENGNQGVFFRMVPAGDGSWLVNLINYNAEPRQVELTGNGEWFDLIREEKSETAFQLPPVRSRLLRFTPKK